MQMVCVTHLHPIGYISPRVLYLATHYSLDSRIEHAALPMVDRRGACR